MEHVEGIFISILSGTNEERNQAQILFQNLIKDQPNEVLKSLVHGFLNFQDQKLRSMSVIYLKKITGIQSIWNKLTNETKSIIKNGLLEALKNEPTPPVRDQLNDAVAELYSSICNDNEWPELLDNLVHFVKSQDNHVHRESGLYILGQICSLKPQKMREHAENILELAKIGLQDHDFRVQMATIVSISGFIVMAKSKQLMIFQSLIPSILNILTTFLNNHQLKEAYTILKILGDWADISPSFFNEYISSVVNIAINICESNLDYNTVYQSIQFMSTLISTNLNQIMAIDGFINKYINILHDILLRVDDDTIEEWNQSEDTQVDYELSQYELAKVCLSELSNSLGSKLIPYIMDNLFTLIQSAEWKHKHTGILAISLIAEGCKIPFLNSIGDIVRIIVPNLHDSHPRVRWAAVHAIGELSLFLSPTLQNQFSDVIIPEFLKLLDPKEFSKVQIETLISLGTFCEKIEKKTLIVYLDDLLKKLYILLSVDNKSILEENISTIAIIASRVQEHFKPYYDTFIPFFKHILNQTHGPEYRLLRGKTFECITIVGISVGKEKFYPDAHEILIQLEQSNIGEIGSDDSNIDFLLEASARICKVLRQDFLPFLPSILPLVLSIANMKHHHYLKEVTTNHKKEGWQYKLIGNKKIGIRNTALEQKSIACQILLCFIDVLKVEIYPYLNEILQTVLPLLSFIFHKGIRITVRSMIHPLLRIAMMKLQDQNMQTFLELFNTVFNQLLNATMEETELDVQALMCETIADCLHMLPKGMLSTDIIEESIKMIVDTVNEFNVYRKEFLQAIEDENDEELMEHLMERDEEEYDVLAQLAEVAGVLARKHTEMYIPYFEKITEFVLSLITKENPYGNKYLGFCMLDDIIENTNERFCFLLPHFAPLIIESCLDEHISLRYVTSHGIGVCAQRCKENFNQYVDMSLKNLMIIIEQETANSQGKNTDVKENAICAFGKVLLYQETDKASLFPLWLSWLPLNVDELEACDCHEIFSIFIEQNGHYLWGEDFQNLPKILEIISFCIKDKNVAYVKPTTKDKLMKILKDMISSNPDLINQAVSVLSLEDQENLKQKLYT